MQPCNLRPRESTQVFISVCEISPELWSLYKHNVIDSSGERTGKALEVTSFNSRKLSPRQGGWGLSQVTQTGRVGLGQKHEPCTVVVLCFFTVPNCWLYSHRISYQSCPLKPGSLTVHISHVSSAISQCPQAKASESSLAALCIPSDTGLGSEWSPGLAPPPERKNDGEMLFSWPPWSPQSGESSEHPLLTQKERYARGGLCQTLSKMYPASTSRASEKWHHFCKCLEATFF